MSDDKIRLGGMALGNGVLVHGPRSWACAVRGSDGELRVASGEKELKSSEIESPLLRGLARIGEMLAVLPAVRRELPEAELPFRQGRVIATVAGCALAAKGLRSSRLGPVAQESAAALLALAPVAMSLRGTEIASYHGAEHISIGSYEHGERRAKEHERCGSHLIGPMVATQAAAQALAVKAPERYRGLARTVGALGAVGVSTEIFGWMVRHPESKVARALAYPGHELQHRLATEEPSDQQVEVAEAALRACLELEEAAAAE